MSRPQLVGLDETLMHQAPWPFRFAAISDNRFFDRHWLSMVDPAGRGGLLAGAAFYKNMGVCDGYSAMQYGDRQYNVRFSRPLTDDLEEIRVGDVHIQIVEPFRRLRLHLVAGSSPMAAELEWTSDFGTYVEEHTFDAPAGRVQQDATRYDQIGTWDGWFDFGEGRIDVDRWWGVRDHSWGVRPGVGGFDRSLADPTLDKSSVPASPRDPMLHVVFYCHVGDLFLGIHYKEDDRGQCLYSDGEAIWQGGRRVDMRSIEFDATFIPGSRTYSSLRADVILEDAQELHIEATPLLHPWAYSGTGYDAGYWDGLGLGAWRGTVAEHDIYQYVPPEEVRRDGVPIPPGHREQPVLLSVNGVSGQGYCPLMTRGALPRYGLV